MAQQNEYTKTDYGTNARDQKRAAKTQENIASELKAIRQLLAKTSGSDKETKKEKRIQRSNEYQKKQAEAVNNLTKWLDNVSKSFLPLPAWMTKTVEEIKETSEKTLSDYGIKQTQLFKLQDKEGKLIGQAMSKEKMLRKYHEEALKGNEYTLAEVIRYTADGKRVSDEEITNILESMEVTAEEAFEAQKRKDEAAEDDKKGLETKAKEKEAKENAKDLKLLQVLKGLGASFDVSGAIEDMADGIKGSFNKGDSLLNTLVNSLGEKGWGLAAKILADNWKSMGVLGFKGGAIAITVAAGFWAGNKVGEAVGDVLEEYWNKTAAERSKHYEMIGHIIAENLDPKRRKLRKEVLEGKRTEVSEAMAASGLQLGETAKQRIVRTMGSVGAPWVRKEFFDNLGIDIEDQTRWGMITGADKEGRRKAEKEAIAKIPAAQILATLEKTMADLKLEHPNKNSVLREYLERIDREADIYRKMMLRSQKLMKRSELIKKSDDLKSNLTLAARYGYEISPEAKEMLYAMHNLGDSAKVSKELAPVLKTLSSSMKNKEGADKKLMYLLELLIAKEEKQSVAVGISPKKPNPSPNQTKLKGF